MKISTRVLVAAFAASLSVGAGAVEFQKPEAAQKYRQSAFSIMGTHFGDLGAMVKGDKPFNAKEAQDDAEIVALMSAQPWKAFGPGTEGGKAKPAIWKEMDKVKAGADDLMKATAALKVAAATGNLDNIKKAFGETQKTCKACHDSYKDK